MIDPIIEQKKTRKNWVKSTGGELFGNNSFLFQTLSLSNVNKSQKAYQDFKSPSQFFPQKEWDSIAKQNSCVTE